MNPEIKNRFTGAVIVPAGKYASTREAVEKSMANLRWADLRGANLRWADLRGADLCRADLSWADLSEADLRGADLRGADLCETDLRGADLSRADLSWADLSWANLRWADLSWANLRWANLSEAYLSRADLCEADLRGANLCGADLVVIQAGIYMAFVQPDKTRIGCEYHSNADWRKWTPDDVAHMAGDAREWWTQYKPVIIAAMGAVESRKKDGE